VLSFFEVARIRTRRVRAAHTSLSGALAHSQVGCWRHCGMARESVGWVPAIIASSRPTASSLQGVEQHIVDHDA
jgi:hypothetical protein